MIVVIDGPDGSGKTTISRKLERLLKNAGVKTEYKKFELSLENLLLSKCIYNLSKFFVKINREKRRKELGKVFSGKNRKSFKDKFISNFIILDKTLTAIFMKLKYRKTTCILDAYIYDNLVPLYCRGLILKKIYNFILSLKPFIRGNIEIILDGPTEKLFERRKGTDYDSIDFVNCNRKYFIEIARRMKSPVIYVDSPVDITINKVLRAILKQLPGYNQEEHLLHVLSDPFFCEKPKEIRNEIINMFDFEKINWNKVLNIAKKQKILLLLLQNLIILPIEKDLKVSFKDNLNKALELRDKRLKLIKEVIDILNENDINYAIFKSIPPFFSELDSDLDILIDTNDIPKAIDVLKEESWVHAYTIPKRISEKIDLFFYPSLVLSKQGFEIDFHDSITWGMFTIPTSEIKNILKYKREMMVDGIKTYTLPEEHELIFIITHALCKHNRANLWDIHAIRGLLKRKVIDIKKAYEISKKYNILRLLDYFFDIYKIKNIFYWKDAVSNNNFISTIGRNKIYHRGNWGDNWRRYVTPSEIQLSVLKKITSCLGIEHYYNFYKELISGLKQLRWLYNTYKNKLK